MNDESIGVTSVQYVLAEAGYHLHPSVAHDGARAVLKVALQSGEYMTRGEATERSAKDQRDAERWKRSWAAVSVELDRYRCQVGG